MGNGFNFEAFGVSAVVRGNDEALLIAARETIEHAFVGRARFLEKLNKRPEQEFDLTIENGEPVLRHNSRHITEGGPIPRFLRFFNSFVRISVAEFAKELVFLHAGAVAVAGRGVIIPGSSFSGKTTLVSELVKRGAIYYSDEYAILDIEGFLQPFPRKLSVRYFDGIVKEKEVGVDELGGTSGDSPIAVKLVLLSSFTEGGRWEPSRLTSGQGIMEMIPHTIPFNAAPDFSLKVLNKVASRAIIVKSPRGEAEEFAKLILEFLSDCNL